MNLKAGVTYVPSPDAIESRLGEETVILHIGSGTYFGLDAVGTVVWEQLGKTDGMTPPAICDQVRAVFTDAPDTVDSEVTSFLEELVEHGLIQQA
ncbi:PqqD family protein [Tateyamaria pelophila]|uniref:PqqD family protein n=1 Tax=Tateyamaria pelophila TaxID=328415 RepID=UPI001CC04998|nr:PqqD family protein [Tateyamaria pelophila]